MTAASGKRYWAFLSYSHADAAAAAELHRALERYALPARVRRAHALPRRLVPIFRDVEELEAAAGLTSRLQTALDESRWLIVLCSPAAAQSRYVNDEIAYFLHRHGPDRILCALLDGEPAQSFPPAIRSLREEPLAADFRAGRDPGPARLKLLAALAGVSFGELADRDAQRRRRGRIAAAAFVAGAFAGAFGYWDLYRREFVDHYAHYVRRNGIWEGVDRLAPPEALLRDESYRFTRRGRRNPPERVDLVDRAGACPGDGMSDVLGGRPLADRKGRPARLCTVTFDYSRDGRIVRETHLAELGVDYGTVLGEMTYVGPDLAQLITYNPYTTFSSASGIRLVIFRRDAQGFDRKLMFQSEPGKPQATLRGEYGLAYDYDAAGRVIRRAVLDRDGRETAVITP